LLTSLDPEQTAELNRGRTLFIINESPTQNLTDKCQYLCQ